MDVVHMLAEAGAKAVGAAVVGLAGGGITLCVAWIKRRGDRVLRSLVADDEKRAEQAVELAAVQEAFAKDAAQLRDEENARLRIELAAQQQLTSDAIADADRAHRIMAELEDEKLHLELQLAQSKIQTVTALREKDQAERAAMASAPREQPRARQQVHVTEEDDTRTVPPPPTRPTRRQLPPLGMPPRKKDT